MDYYDYLKKTKRESELRGPSTSYFLNSQIGHFVNEVITDKDNLKEVDVNLYSVIPSVCKIRVLNKSGTGFLIKLYKNSKELFCFLTNEHVITKEFIDSHQAIYIFYNCEKEYRMIKLNPSERFIKYFREMDVTLIEIIKADKIEDKYFLLPYGSNISKNEEIYIIQFPEGKLSHSSGIITEINNYNLTHKASTKFGSSGSPIFLKGTTKVIGIHKQGNSTKKENYGTLINPVIELLQNENNKNDSKIGQLVNGKGEIYIGPVNNKLPNGEGKLYNKNNEIIYEGNFVNGIEEGEGQRITKDYKYVGQFISGKMFGEGKIFFKNGKVK